MDPMVIVGAGECGTRAAFTLREQGVNGREGTRLSVR